LDILTKICIVILVVLVLMGCTVFISLATERVNYRGLYEKEREARAVEAATAQNALLGEQKNSEVFNGQIAAFQKENVDLRDRLNQKTADFEKEQAGLAALTASIKGMEGSLALMDKSLSHLIADSNVVREQLRVATAKVADLTQANLDQDKRLQKANVDNDGLRKLVAVKEEQLKDLQVQIADLQDKLKAYLAGGGGVVPAKVGPGEVIVPDSVPGIDGTVNDVSGDLVAINVGSTQGIKKGMKLIIYRGGIFVGRLTVDYVEARESGGRITDKQVDPRKGDKVTSDSR
jgi:hypothetical protein